MKLMHVHAKSNADVRLPVKELAKLSKAYNKWGIATTIQHLHKINDVVKQLKAKLAGQVLGCNAFAAEKIANKVDAFLFVGSGHFHPIQIALRTKKPVWLWNPVTKKLGRLEKAVVEKFLQRKKAALVKFFHADTIGIIVSTKLGQKNLARALELKKQTNKKCYLFACDTLDMSEFENFPFIDFWVNTACPRIPDSAVNMINIDDLIEAGVLKLKKERMAYEVPMWKT